MGCTETHTLLEHIHDLLLVELQLDSATCSNVSAFLCPNYTLGRDQRPLPLGEQSLNGNIRGTPNFDAAQKPLVRSVIRHKDTTLTVP